MSGTKLTNWSYLDSDYEDEITSKNILKKGWYNCDFTNLAATSESEIAAGSSIDIDGVMYIFESQESITGSETSSSINYIRVFDSGGSAVAEYTATAPEWDQDKKGWYDSATGLKRYILRFYYTGSLYQGKTILQNNKVDLSVNVTALSADYTIQEVSDNDIYLVTTTDTEKVTVTLPTAKGSPGRIIKILKISNTFAPVVIDTYSTETINGWSYTVDSVTYQLVPIFFQNECCEMISDGSNWNIINSYVPTYDTGICYYAGSSVGFGFGIEKITLTGISGDFEMFEVIEGGTSGQLAIISYIDSGNGYFWILQSSPEDKTSGNTGPFQSETITGGTSGATGTYSTHVITEAISYPFINQNQYEIDTGYYNTKPIQYDFEVQDTWSKIKGDAINSISSIFVSDGGGTNLAAGIAISYDRTTSGYIDILFYNSDGRGCTIWDISTPRPTWVGGSPFWFRATIKG